MDMLTRGPNLLLSKIKSIPVFLFLSFWTGETNGSSIQIGGILPPPGTQFDLAELRHFILKNQTRNIDKPFKGFWTMSSIPA